MERASERESVCVFVCERECVYERERGKENERMRERMCGRERERVRERGDF